MSETVQAKLEALRAALIEGEQSGSASPFNFEAFLARNRAQSLQHDDSAEVRLGLGCSG